MPRYDFQYPPRPSVVAALRGQAREPTLRPFQREGVRFLTEHNFNALLCDAPGCGKTPQILRCIYENKERLTPALVIAPSSVVWNWRREARKWAPGLSCAIVSGYSGTPPPADITVCSWDLVAPRLGFLKQRGFKFIAADEAHYARNPDSQRGAATLELCQQTRHVIPMSGTPLINTLDEWDAVKALIGRKDPPMIRRLIEDVAKDIPPKKRIMLDVSIPPDAMREYRKAETEFGDYLDDTLRAAGHSDAQGVARRTMSAQALTKVGYLRRILGRAKAMSAAAWIVRQIRAGEPVVVFAEHKGVLNTLADVLDGAGIKYGRLDGGTNRKDRQTAIDGFQAGDFSVFLGSKAAKEGITLHRARHMLFVERWFTPADEEQAEDRIRRIGQRYETFIWFMQVPGTYDERMSEIVESKRTLVRMTIGANQIERQDATGLLGEWLRGQPAGEADLEMPDFPDLPYGSKVHAIIFSAKNWTPDTVKRWLKIHDYRPRGGIAVKGSRIKATMRPAVGYVPHSFHLLNLGPDMAAIIGQPRRVRKLVRSIRHRHRYRRT